MLRGTAALLVLSSCATSPEPSEVRPPPAPKTAPAPRPAPDAGAAVGFTIHEAPSKPPADYAPEMGFKEMTEKEWLNGIKERIGQRWKVTRADLRFSPARQLIAFVRSPEPVTAKKIKPPRRHQIVVVDLQGTQRNLFRPVTVAKSDEPPKELRFLSEDRLIYEVVLPPPPPAPAPAPAKKAHRTRGKARPAATVAKPPEPPGPPRHLFVIQPLVGRTRPIRCDGVRFTFSAKQERLAFVAGPPERGFVAVDGAQVYPRRGRTMIATDLAWSRDGHSLAFLEVRASGPPRLVLLAEFDNPTGDATWDLPPNASVDGVRVFWSGPGKLVVGKSIMRPVFAASFVKEKPIEPVSR